MSKFGEMLKRKRIEFGETQDEFGRRLGYSLQYISDIERGTHMPAAKKVIEIAEILELDLNELKG